MAKKLSRAMKRRKLNRKAKPEHFFWLSDGTVVRSVKELAESFGSMDDHVYYHHANHQKNDFSNWVADIFNEKQLAKNLMQASNKIEAQLITLRHLVKNL